MVSIQSSLRSLVGTTLALLGTTLLAVALAPAAAGQAQYVIEISIDGGGSSYIQTLIDQGLLPNFKRFQTEGAWTNNARNDYDLTVTLPNHVSMVTGRGVYGVASNGHLWTSNSDPSTTPTATNYSIQNNKGAYVYGVFDVAHDHGLHTALYASKSKFSLFNQSYNLGNGAPDVTGTDNGTNKIDTYYYHSSSTTMTTAFVGAMGTNPFHYVLLHYNDGDAAGHSSGWGSPTYNNALVTVDTQLGRIFDLIEGTPALRENTDVILTADHGGKGTDHSTATEPLNYTVPLYVWGPDAKAGADLYSLNPATRLDPGTGRPTYTAALQPIRNSELANLALNLLGLGPVPGSTIDPAQNLVLAAPSTYRVTATAGTGGSIDPASATVAPGATATFTVGAGSGYRIDRVTGCGGSLSGDLYTAGYTTGPVTADCTITASFAPIQHLLTLTVTGKGTVHSDPAPDLACTGSCTQGYAAGTVVTLTAGAGVDAYFSGWSGSCVGTGQCQVTMDTARSVTAAFSLVPVAETIQFDAAAYAVTEGAGPITLWVRRLGTASGRASVKYATGNGTARAKSDYTAKSGTLTWAAGETASKGITVPIINDSTREVAETFVVKLGAASGTTLGTIGTATVTISDND